MSKKRKLTVKQQAFADYYVELGNAEQAALKAGYSKNYARGQSYKLLANVGIKSYIEKRQEELKSERVADQQEILEFLTSVIRGEATGTELVGKGKGKQEVQQEPPSVAEKTKAAELLGKRFLMWTEKHQVEGDMQVTIVDDIPTSDNNENESN